MSTNTKEWTPDEGVVEVQDETKPALPKGVKRSFRKGGNGYTFTVKLDGHAVYCQALDTGATALVADADRAFIADGQRIQRESAQKKLTPEQAQNQSFAMIEARQRAYYDALAKCVQAWDLPDDDGTPLPLDAEILEFADVIRLVTQIQQKSSIGAGEENF